MTFYIGSVLTFFFFFLAVSKRKEREKDWYEPRCGVIGTTTEELGGTECICCALDVLKPNILEERSSRGGERA